MHAQLSSLPRFPRLLSVNQSESAHGPTPPQPKLIGVRCLHRRLGSVGGFGHPNSSQERVHEPTLLQPLGYLGVTPKRFFLDKHIEALATQATAMNPQVLMGPAGGATRPGRFFGVYLLYCLNPRHRGRVYVGFTVNPARRVQQHNGGRKKGGAWRTSGRGPWEMVLIVHGFPSSVAALRFEWAWQHPHASRRLAHVAPRLRSEGAFAFHLRVLAHMLRAPPWARLPLTLRWLRADFRQELCPPPPPHVPLAFGPLSPGVLASKHRTNLFADTEPQPEQNAEAPCTLCARAVQDEEGPLCCPHPGCSLRAHMICLAQEFLQEEPGQLLPLEGQCPGCKNSLLWGDLVWLCRMGTEEEEEDLELEEEHWTDMLEI